MRLFLPTQNGDEPGHFASIETSQMQTSMTAAVKPAELRADLNATTIWTPQRSEHYYS